MILVVLKLCLSVLSAVMAARAFQSGTLMDRVLATALLIGLLSIFTVPVAFSVAWLITCSGAYLLSQVLTSARLLSRTLPILTGVLAGVLYWLVEAGG